MVVTRLKNKDQSAAQSSQNHGDGSKLNAIVPMLWFKKTYQEGRRQGGFRQLLQNRPAVMLQLSKRNNM
jgi:hypothetical protein